jgi:DNA-binding transcriptional ArsR family regulator
MGKDGQPKHRQAARELLRRKAQRQPAERLLIVCEGSKTEPLYLGEIRQQLRLPSANVQVQPAAYGTEPLRIVEYAERLFTEHIDANKATIGALCINLLPALLFPEYRRRVLGLLLLRPEEALHGREIARRTGLPAGTITRELGKLAEVGLLKREKRGNQQVYSADTSGPIFTELASILRKTSGLADVLVQALAPVATQLRVAFVFGSVAQGRETSGSDIDVMLIGDISFRQAVELLHPTQTVLGREVNPKLFSTTSSVPRPPLNPSWRTCWPSPSCS